MDGVARLEDGCPQVPGATCYQDIVLFIVVLQGSAATTLSPLDLSIIQPAHEAPRVGCKSERIPRTGLIFTILINHAPSQELVIYSEMIMSCFNHSLTDSLTLHTAA